MPASFYTCSSSYGSASYLIHYQSDNLHSFFTRLVHQNHSAFMKQSFG